MKCKTCNNIWFQENPDYKPPQDEAIDNIADQIAEADSSQDQNDIDPNLTSLNNADDEIPDAVKPEQDSNDHDKGTEEDTQTNAIIVPLYSVAGGIGTALALLLVLILFKGLLVSAMPTMNNFYSAIGLAESLPGEDLVFDQLRITPLGSTFVIEGNVINLASEARKLPTIAALPLDESGVIIGETFIYTLEEENLEGENLQAFAFSIPAMADDIKNIEIRFTLDTEGAIEAEPYNAVREPDQSMLERVNPAFRTKESAPKPPKDAPNDTMHEEEDHDSHE